MIFPVRKSWQTVFPVVPSKIELTNVELIAGFDNSQFDHVKNSMRIKFSSLKKTTEIEWLESEETIKELRKQKLKKIAELEKN